MTLVVREVQVATPHLRLAARAWGEAPGDRGAGHPPLLALHGWLDNAASFDRIVPLLGERHVVALDLPGHGRSEHHAPGYLYGFLDLAAEVVQAVEALGWQRFDLMGHSLGAALATVVAATLPTRVAHLVLLEGLGPLVETDEGTPLRFANALVDEAKRATGRLRVYADVREAAARLRQLGQPLSPEAALLLAERGTRPCQPGVVWSADPAMRVSSRQRLTEAQVRAFLRRITAPTLFIRAGDGWPVSDQIFVERLACIPSARRVDLPGHHHVHLDHPDDVATHVGPFLNAGGA